MRLLLADAQSLFREAVRSVLEEDPDFEVVAVASDGVEAVTEAERTTPDVALVDLQLPNGDGLRAAREIRERVPGCAVVVVGSDEDERLLVSSIEAGARGYVPKAAPLSELLEGVRAVHRGEAKIPPAMLAPLLSRLVNRGRRFEEARRALARLTSRERDVLTLLSEGADKDGIARALVISPQTARTHVQNVLGKLGVHSRLEAAALVHRTGIVEYLETEKAEVPG